MFECLMLVLFYLAPMCAFMNQYIKYEQELKGYVTVAEFAFFGLVSLIPAVNIVFAFVIAHANGYFSGKLFVKDK